MESKVKLFGHPLHQVLIVFPLGLLITSTLFDWLAYVTHNKKLAMSAVNMTAAGLIGAVAASVFGLIDWLAIPEGTRAKKIGLWHALGNSVLTLLFGLNWRLRRADPERPTLDALMLSLMGSALGGATGWMGGELVDRLGVGVHEGANLNAPSSLSGLPATAGRAVTTLTKSQ